MSDTHLRHWMMLREIPRAPRKISTAQLVDRLLARGLDVDVRTVQRDLQKLSTVFPLLVDDSTKPFGWSFSRDGASLDVPAMDVHTALAFRLADEHLRRLLPEATLVYLEPHFSLARAVLAETRMGAWPDKVRVLSGGPPLQPPNIEREVLETVHTALLSERRLLVRYRRRGEEQVRDYLVSPHGLVWRDAVGYLVCTAWEYDDPLQLALHRMVEARVSDQPRRVPERLSIDQMIQGRAFDFPLAQGEIDLELLLDRAASARLREMPLDEAQILTDEGDGRVRLRARVADTTLLRAWLRGFGELCEVVAPDALRAELAAEAERLARRYAGQAV